MVVVRVPIVPGPFSECWLPRQPIYSPTELVYICSLGPYDLHAEVLGMFTRADFLALTGS